MIFLIYLLLINIVSAYFFYSDKKKAQKNKMRIPEKTLHILELMGGVFSILLLMKYLRHKNRKFKYFMYTYVALVLWIIIVIFWIIF